VQSRVTSLQSPVELTGDWCCSAGLQACLGQT